MPDITHLGAWLHQFRDVGIAIAIGAILVGYWHHRYATHRAAVSRELALVQAQSMLARPRRQRSVLRPVVVLGVLAAGVWMVVFGAGHLRTTSQPPAAAPAPAPAPTHTQIVHVPEPVTKVLHQAPHFPVTLFVVVIIAVVAAVVVLPLARRLVPRGA